MKTLNSQSAFALMKTALESKAMNLLGAGSTERAATENAKLDAMYLLTLFNALTEGQTGSTGE